MDSDFPTGDEKERDRRKLERVLPELFKRAVEVGYEKLTEGPENVRAFVHDLKLPKEVLQLFVAQLEETTNGLSRAVSREVRDFLEKSSLADELTKALTRVSLEIRTEVRFVPQDKLAKPEVRSEVKLNTDARRESEPSQSGEERGAEAARSR